MKSRTILLIALCATFFSAFSQKEIIELPLTMQSGYGPFNVGAGGISAFSEDENNPWIKTYSKILKSPVGLTDIKYGDIETNIYQSVYQNYLLGNITKKRYEELQESWNWTPDTLMLSKTPIKTKIAFAYGKDSDGVTRMAVDANNNLDLSDDEIFTPFDMGNNAQSERDSLAEVYAIPVVFETFTHNKAVSVTFPIFVAHYKQIKMFACSFAQYATTQYKGENIAICSDNFTNLSYKSTGIILVDGMRNGEKAKEDDIIQKNEYIEIKGEVYKNLGVNTNKNVLILEKVDLPKAQLLSTQVGYKAYSFSGKEFTTNSEISLENLKGKYVLLDFWAEWCSPCIKEIPALKELYAKTDRAKFEIIGIIGDSTPNGIKKQIDRLSITYPQILSDEIVRKYGVTSYPTTLILDAEGVIVAKNLIGKELEEKILSLIE